MLIFARNVASVLKEVVVTMLKAQIRTFENSHNFIQIQSLDIVIL